MSLRKEHKVVVVRCCDAVGRVGTGQDTDALDLSGLGAEEFPVIGKEVDLSIVPLVFCQAHRCATWQLCCGCKADW